MADDIDIEEHDVLDNPRIKNIFPDLSIIKTEPPDIHGEDIMQCEFDNETAENHVDSLRDALRFEEFDGEYSRYNNKIILGRKPCTSNSNNLASRSDHNSLPEESSSLIFGSHLTQTIKSEPLSDDFDNVQPEVFHHPSPVMIVGSKPSRENSVAHKRTDINNPDIKDSVVLLEDWGPQLKRSLCYCKDCEILFPTRNCLDFHNSSVHSFLVAVGNNRAVKSTTRNTARKSTGPVIEWQTAKSKFCNHCKKTFPNDTALITHLYEILPSDKFECDKCGAVFKKETELLAHLKSHDSVLADSEVCQYYRCNVCSCYFAQKVRYASHMLKFHGKTVVNFHIKLPFEGKCLFCRYVGSNQKYYNKHITKVHANLFYEKGKSTLNAVHKVKAMQKSVSRILYKFQCLHCNKKFPSYYSAKKHKNESHPELKNLKIFNKLAIRKAVPLTQGQKLAKAPIRKAENKICPIPEELLNQTVPKDILFKCNHCQIHFTSCSEAVAHSGNCLKYKGDWKCQKCRRTFKFNDRTVHQHQHDISERFNVYLVHDTLYGKVLCKCPHCNLYLHEKEFWEHLKVKCRNTKPANCRICDLPIHFSSLDEHNKWHRNSKIIKNESILIEFVVRSNTDDATVIAKPNKRKMLEEVNETPSKKSKVENDERKTLYYCVHCKCYLRNTKYVQHHYKGQCKTSSKDPVICKLCGLSTKSQRHADQHKSDRGMKLINFKFVRIQDNKTINPPMPVYPKCKKCEVQFISILALNTHDCNEGSKTCTYCNHKFSDLAYKLHVKFHEYRTNRIKERGIGETTRSAPKTVTPQEPKYSQKPRYPQKPLAQKTQIIEQELLKNYLLLTETWKILYRCEICDIVCDSYDKTVEHSQNHYSNMESYDMTIETCQICDLKFDSTCFGKHKELHTTNNAINKDSFDIFTYNYMHLPTDDWYNLFGNLPKTKIQQIVSQSIYNYSRTVKMRIVKDGPPANTLFQCAQCDKYVNPPTLAQHYKYASCSKKVRKFHCSICDIYFASVTARNAHVIAHKRGKTKTFRTVLINENGDEAFNLAMRTNLDKTRVVAPDSDKTRVEAPVQKGTNKAKRLYTYYQCNVCDCCIKLISKKNAHECSNCRIPKKHCPKCGMLFRVTHLKKHMTSHQTLPGFERKNIKIVRFDPRNPKPQQADVSSVEKVAKIYKCRCGLHFISSKAVNTHLELCCPQYKVSKENCSQCGLLFATDALVSHLCSHHSTDKYSRFEVEELATGQAVSANIDAPNVDDIKEIFKCIKCDLCFLSMYSINYHFESKHQTQYAVRCDECGLQFTGASLKRHIDYHHKQFKCQLKDLRIRAFDAAASLNKGRKPQEYKLSKTSLSKIDMRLYNKNLYKCASCDVHYLTKHSYHSHVASDTHKIRDSMKRVKCNQCGLAFNLQSLHRHKYIHHDKLKLLRKHFNIIVPLNQFKDSTEIDIPQGLSKEKFSKTIYKCVECDVHFVLKGGFQKHLSKHQRVKSAIACTVCGLKFTKNSLLRHVAMHHQIGNLKREDFCIKTDYSLKDVALAGNTGAAVLSTLDSDENEESTARPDENFDKDGSNNGNAENGGNESNKTDDWYERVLYKCEICDVNFVTASGLETHKAKRQHRLPKVECDRCNLKFTAQTLYKHHEIHHEKLGLTLEDMWIVGRMPARFHLTALHSLIYSEYLYKCNTCSIHLLTRRTFEDHVAECDGTAAKTQCIVCDLVFSKSSISQHFKIQHEILKLSRKDFHIVEEAEESAAGENISFKDSENAQKDASVTNRSPANLEETIYINDDEYESTGISSDKTQMELSGSLPSKSSESTFNETAGRSSNEHSSYSKCLYKCPICSLHFMSEGSLSKHISMSNKHSNPITYCDICGLGFSAPSVIKHKHIHHFKMKLSLRDFKIVEGSLEGKAAVENNVLYKCNVCNLHFASEFSHNSHTCKLDIDPDIANLCRCSKCGLVFHATTALRRHRYLHHEENNFTRKDLAIVIPRKDKQDSAMVDREHNSSTTLQNKTVVAFRGQKSYQLSDKYKASINMSGYNEYIYKCTKCNLHYMTTRTLNNHFCLKASFAGIKCTLCDLVFSAHSLAKHEYIHHERLGLKFEDLRVLNDTDVNGLDTSVSVDDASIEQMDIDNSSSINTHNSNNSVGFEDESNTADVSTASTSIGETEVSNPKKSKKLRSYNLPASFKVQVKLSSFSNTLYKCGTCSMHYLDCLSLNKHKYSCDGSVKNVKKCSVCGLAFTFITVEKHMFIHHTKLKLKREDMKVVCSHSRVETAASEKEKTRELNDSIGNTNTKEQVISKSSTDKTDKVVFQDTTDLERETPMSESTMIQNEIDNLTISLIDSDDEDISECSTATSNKESPSKSQLNTSDKNTLKPKVVVSESTSSDDIESSTEVKSTKEVVDNDTTLKTKCNVKLYKCGECNVYFMTQSTCYKHTVKHNPLKNIEFIDCKLCGLAFRIIALHKHMLAHHKNEFKLEDVLVEEYLPNIHSKGTPKIDIYYAIDKVQSRHVSTSSEVSGKDIDTTAVNQGNRQNEIVTSVPEEVTYSQEIVTKHSSIIGSTKKDENLILECSENTDLSQVTEKAIQIDITDSQSTENKGDKLTFNVAEPKSTENINKDGVTEKSVIAVDESIITVKTENLNILCEPLSKIILNLLNEKITSALGATGKFPVEGVDIQKK